MSKFIDLTGQTFGFWTVINKVEKTKSNQTQWLCLCICGTSKYVTSNSLRSCNSTSCGCNHNPILIGRIFGNLTVIESYDTKDNKRHWTCKCSCGSNIIANTNELLNELITSCGCKKLIVSNQKLQDSINVNQNLIDKNIELKKESKRLMLKSKAAGNAFMKELSKSIELLNSIKSKLNK